MQALKGIHNAAEDFATAESIFEPSRDLRPGLVPALTIAAARLADDMAEAFGSFAAIAESSNGKGARVLASFGAMAAELRRLQDSEAKAKAELAALRPEALALETSLTGSAARNGELVAQLRDARERLDSVAYDIGELPARLVLGEVPAAASLIQALPDIRESIRQADSVLADND